MTKTKQKKPAKTDEDLDVFEEWEGEGEDLPEGTEGEGGFAADEGEEDFDEGENLLELPELEDEPAEVEEERPAPAPRAPAAAKPAKAARPNVPPAAKAAPKPAAPVASAPKKFDQAALDLAPDVPVQVIAVMGKRGISVKELMELRMGQVIDLKRPPNETVDIVVNGKLFARGELVEIDGKLGVRILKLAK
jgi:type III secretion system YscQ/HrcQ family protein